MKKLIILTLVFAFSFAGCAPREEVAEVVPARVVSVMTVGTSEIKSEFTYSGKVKPIKEANVFSTVQGKAGKAYFDIGDRVKEGDVLFQMDTSDIKNNLTVLKATLATSEANLASAKTALEMVNGAAMQSQIANAKAALDNATLAYNNAKTSYENNKVLFDSGILAQADIDKIKMAYETSEVAYNQAVANYDITTTQIPVENERRANDAYQIALASKNSVAAQMASTEKMIKDASVKSPIEGVVISRGVVSGTVVAQQAPAFVIANMDTVEILVGVSEQVVNSIKISDDVNVKLSAVSEDMIAGKVTSINPAASEKGTYDIKIEIANASGLIKVGMLSEVNFVDKSDKNAIVAPRESVISKDNETYVFVEDGGKAKKVLITTGIDSGSEVQVLGGLNAGDKLIIKGQSYLNDGDEIKISEPSKLEEAEKEA